MKGYIVVNFEVASFSSFQDFPKRLFCDGEVGDGSSGMNAICSRPEIAGDVIFCEDAETFHEYVCINVCVASFSIVCEKNRNRPFM